MEEQEILSRLKAHVACHQSFSPDEQRPLQLHVDACTLDLSNIDRLSAEVWTSREAVGQINPRTPGLLNPLAQSIKRIIRRSLSWYTRSLQMFHYNVALALQEHGSAIKSTEQSLRRLEDRILQLQNDLPALERLQQASENQALQESLRAADLAVQEQQGPYVEFFRGLSPVVDVGCGRGEFLELLKENGIAAHGVDSDHAACEAARRKLLEVAEADLFEHLQELPDRSLGGAFAARVIEYLPTHRQPELLDLLSRKMKPGGALVIETMNPESRLGFGRNFRLDPTRLHALHPELLQSLLESSCFVDVKLCSLVPAEGILAPATNSGESPDHSESRRRLIPSAAPRLSSIQAYAAVARRS